MNQQKYGLFKGMLDTEYHFQRDEISSSGLKLITDKTPAHYQYEFLDEKYKQERLEKKLKIMSGEDAKNSHLRFGQAFHIMLLEPDHFNERVIRWSGLPRNRKEGKEDFNVALSQLKPGMLTMTEAEYEKAQRMCESIMGLKTARDMLGKNIEAEASLFWHDETFEVDCKARLDAFILDEDIIVDIKTAANADHESFRRDAYNRRYYMQAAFYMRAYEKVMGKPAKGFCWFVFEKEPPFAPAIYYATEDELDLGNYDLDLALEQYATCLKRNSWNGYEDKFVALGLPKWAMYRLENG